MPHADRASRRRATHRLLACAAVVVASAVLALSGVAPAAAHAELESTTPVDGARLDRAPAEVRLTFTEPVTLVDGGVRLLGGESPVPTPPAEAEGAVVVLPLPELPDGGYVVDWRVLSADGHPIAGAFGFGVGADPPAAPSPTTGAGFSTPVALARYAGYLAFVLLVAGATGRWWWGSPAAGPLLHRLVQVGATAVAVTSAVSLVLQAPYAAGRAWYDVFDGLAFELVVGSSYGSWVQLRLLLGLVVLAVLWDRDSLGSRTSRLLAAGMLAALAFTFTGTGHAAGTGAVDRLVDAAHTMAAATWLGGLTVFAVSAATRSGAADVLRRFSPVAIGCVAMLATTGTWTAVLRLERWSDLFEDGYGQLLLAKVAVFTVALAAALVVRRGLARRPGGGRGAVRVEAALVHSTLALTAVLAATTPPAQEGTSTEQTARAEATLDLGSGRSAEVSITGRAGSGDPELLEVALRDADGELLPARRVLAQVELVEGGIGPFDVPLRREGPLWVAAFDFRASGTWEVELTVTEEGLRAVVSEAELEVR